jgi:hypothetical protein
MCTFTEHILVPLKQENHPSSIPRITEQMGEITVHSGSQLDPLAFHSYLKKLPFCRDRQQSFSVSNTLDVNKIYENKFYKP